jgi:selenocysteine-specific elongation factor
VLTQEGKAMLDGNRAKESRFIPDSNRNEDPFVARVEKAFIDYGFLPQTPADAAAALKMDRKKFIEAHNRLRRSGRLIRINADIYIHQRHIDHLINMLRNFFIRKDILTPQDIRDMFGVSRKYGIPLLEYLDSINFTVRVAEGRKLCRGSGFIS